MTVDIKIQISTLKLVQRTGNSVDWANQEIILALESPGSIQESVLPEKKSQWKRAATLWSVSRHVFDHLPLQSISYTCFTKQPSQALRMQPVKASECLLLIVIDEDTRLAR